MNVNLEETFRAFSETHELLPIDAKVLVTVSGGLDSMVLLQLMIRQPNTIGVAHCNFKLRGKESDLDQKFVRDFTRHWKLPFHTTEFDTVNYARNHRLGIQEAARELRYQWLESIAEEHGYDVIATGHHADDQIETVLMNIARGAGFSGLRGMVPKKGQIVRPLLSIRRQELEQYAREYKISSREDRSNRDNKYSRNYLRNKIIPAITERLPGFENRMLENIEIWQKSARLLQGFIQQQIEGATKSENLIQILDCTRIEISLLDLVLFEWLRPHKYNYTQVRQMTRAIIRERSGQIFCGSNSRLTIDRGKIILQQNSPNTLVTIYIEKEDQDLYLSNGKLSLSLLAEPPNTYDNGDIAYFDAQIISFPLILRTWKKGDSFQPFGLKGKSQKLKKFFVNEKMSRFEKEGQWILCSGEKICWIVGRRLDHRFRVTSKTNLCLKVKWEPL